MKNLSRNLGLGIVIGIILFLIFTILHVVSGNRFQPDERYWMQFGYTMIYSVVLTIVNSAYFDYLNKKIDWKNYARYRILAGAVGSILLTMAGIFLIRMGIEMVLEGESWATFIAGEELFYYLIALLITIAISIFFHAFYFYKAWQDRKVKEQKIIAGTASAKFDALKNQLDPHFLFNSLNVLTSLIEEDPEQAQHFTTALSKVYRYVLEQKNKDLVTVDEELQFAQTYVKLLNMRFEDSIQIALPEKSNNPEAQIVPLSLQLLLENAVKHNVVTGQRPLRIEVIEKDNMLVVANNLQEKQVLKKSSGVGLQNIKQRYSILSDREVVVEKSEGQFRVSLPVLTKKISIMESQENYIRDKRYQKAKERVEAIKGFYGNLMAYCIVIPFLAWLNYQTTSFPWVIFPMLGWGFGLLMHGLEAFAYNPIWGKRWEEKKIRELMEREDF